MTEQLHDLIAKAKIQQRDALYDLIKDHVGIVCDLPDNLCVCRGMLNPQQTWLFEQILDIFGLSYED